MRTNVTFCHLAELLVVSEDDGVLAVHGAMWFAKILERVTDLKLDESFCQEDWGVVFLARRNQRKFWIGLSAWDFDGAWLAHFHHGSFAWFQWFGSSGKNELKRLLIDVHNVLVSDPAVPVIAWHEESEMSNPETPGFPAPDSS